jgi:hypothetical protein
MDTLFLKEVTEQNGMCAVDNKWILYSRLSYGIEVEPRYCTEFIDDVGILGTLICNFAMEQNGKNTEVMKVV